MKTILKTMMAMAAIFTIAGCKELPTVEKITAVSKAVGKTAGYACKLANMKPEAKEAITNVLNAVSKVVPQPGKTFAETWTPLADAEISKLVEQKKLDEQMAPIVSTALSAAFAGIDYVFVKYPKAKDVEELAAAAVAGFVDGFKSTVKLSANASLQIDDEAYKYITSKMAK